MIIKYVNGLCGAGKTTNAIKYVGELVKNDNKVIFIQPTIALLTETYLKFINNNPDSKATIIHSENGGSPVDRMINHIIDAQSSLNEGYGEVLFVTHTSFMVASMKESLAKKWHLIIDEIPSVIDTKKFNLERSHRLLTDNIELGFVEPSGFATALPKALVGAVNPLSDMSKAHKDTFYGGGANFAGQLLSAHWDCYMFEPQFNRFITGQIKNDKKAQLEYISILQPTIFAGYKSVTVMGACFTESLMFKLWDGMDIGNNNKVKFIEHKQISEGLRHSHTVNGSLFINYVTDEYWSKSKMKKSILVNDSEVNYLTFIIQRINQYFYGREFIWLGNKSTKDTALLGYRLPNNPYGLNNFKTVDNSVVLSALNPPPSLFKFLQDKNIDGDMVKCAIHRQTAYQAVMRSSLRDHTSTTDKEIVVVDMDTAKWLNNLFPDAVVRMLPNIVNDIIDTNPDNKKVGAPTTQNWTSDAERKEYTRQQEKINLALNEFRTLKESFNDLMDRLSVKLATLAPHKSLNSFRTEGAHSFGGFMSFRHDEFGTLKEIMFPIHFCSSKNDCPIMISDKKINGQRIFGSYKNNVKEIITPELVICAGNDEFVDLLNEWANMDATCKTDNVLFAPSIFEPTKKTKKTKDGTIERTQIYGLENVRAINGIWLDNDGKKTPDAPSVITPNEFAMLFPNIEMHVYNTSSSTMSNPRWRVFIPTTDYMGLEGHKLIVKMIFQKLNENGWFSEKQMKDNKELENPKHHGFDMTKNNAASFFYLPAKAIGKDDEPGYSFVYHFKDNRNALNPEEWIMTIKDTRVVRQNKARTVPSDYQATTPPKKTQNAHRPGSKPGKYHTRQEIEDNALEAFKNAAKGEGGQLFFAYACAMQNNGYTKDEIETKLTAALKYANSKNERKAQITQIIDRFFPNQ